MCVFFYMLTVFDYCNRKRTTWNLTTGNRKSHDVEIIVNTDDTIRYDTIRYDTIRYDTIRYKNSLNETNGTSWSDTHRYDTAFTGIFYTAHMLLPVRLQRLSVQMKAQLNYFASLSSRMARVDKHFTNRRRHTCEDILEPSLDVSLISVDWLHLVLL